jgi:hypothetical protein
VKISALRTAVVWTPWRNLAFVELRTDEGLTGVGEVRMLGHTDALLGYLAEAERRYILGADPFAIEALVQRMYRGDYARAGRGRGRRAPARGRPLRPRGARLAQAPGAAVTAASAAPSGDPDGCRRARSTPPGRGGPVRGPSGYPSRCPERCRSG